MKTKGFVLLLITFLSVMSSALAQTALSKAEIIKFKKSVQLKAEKTKSIKSDFIQTKQISVLNNSVVSSGKLVFKSPNLVKWEYLKPETNIAIFKNNELLVSDGSKSKRINLDSNKWFRQLNDLIVGSVKGNMFDEKTFEISYFKNENGYKVIFKPIEKRLKKFMSQFELTFPYQGFEVKSVKLVEPNNDFTLIEFKNRVDNSAVSDKAFSL
jgi:outer membrane lipoprotein-sorting protein